MQRYASRFEKTVIIIAAVLTAAFITASAVPCAALLAGTFKKERQTAVYSPLTDGSVLRLHVIANSDSEQDQRVKLAVRDAVLDYERRTGTAATAFAAENALLRDGSGLLETVEKELGEQGADYGAQLLIGDFDFPDREYGGVLYPAGSYRALRILLGEAKGRNWWCILFPPLCITDSGAARTEPETKVRFESLIVKLWRLITGGESRLIHEGNEEE
ncbi:MAG: stage II sporulation protein R [Clostridia bacterium]|nr:stage II sporulation protein R [Clostridia bacterium]